MRLNKPLLSKVINLNKWLLLVSAILGFTYGFLTADKHITVANKKPSVPCQVAPTKMYEKSNEIDINLYKVRDYT